jgi:hypothetical protein
MTASINSWVRILREENLRITVSELCWSGIFFVEFPLLYSTLSEIIKETNFYKHGSKLTFLTWVILKRG